METEEVKNNEQLYTACVCYACPESAKKSSEETELRGARPDISQVSNYGMSANEGAPAMCRQLKNCLQRNGTQVTVK